MCGIFVAVTLKQRIDQIRGIISHHITHWKQLRMSESIKNLTRTKSNHPKYFSGYNVSLQSSYGFNFSDSFKDIVFEFDYPQLELPYESQVSLITLYTATTALAVVGNLTAITVLCFGNRCKTGLTRFLLNMAIADLFMACFCMPFNFTNTMLGHWVFGTAMCPIALFIQVASVGISIFTNTAIGIDR